MLANYDNILKQRCYFNNKYNIYNSTIIVGGLIFIKRPRQLNILYILYNSRYI